MKQVILLRSNEKDNLESEITKKLSAELDLEFNVIFDPDKAKTLVGILPDLDFIICFSTKENEVAIKMFEKHLIDVEDKHILFIIGEYFSARKNTKVFTLDTDVEKIVRMAEEISVKNDINKSSAKLSSFVPVRFDFILSFKKVPFPVDFYLRIKISEDEFQYIKRLFKNDIFKEEELQKLISFNLKEIYILKNEYLTFIDFSMKLTSKINNNLSLSNLDYSYHLSRDSFILLGITDENVEYTKKYIGKMEESIAKDGALLDYFKFLIGNPLSFAYSHSYLISIFLSKIVLKFDWDSKAIREKICYIAFFHDISLESDQLIKVHSDEELNIVVPVEYQFTHDSKIKDSKLSKEDRELVLNHASQSSFVLDKFPSLPIGVVQVIKEHHGSKSGVGFNESQSISLQPLAMLFIVVEDFVIQFLNIERPKLTDIENIFIKLKNKYNKGSYKKAVEYLEEFLKSK